MREIMIGNTCIKFNDSLCQNQTEGQMERILQTVSNIAYAEWIRKMSRERSNDEAV